MGNAFLSPRRRKPWLAAGLLLVLVLAPEARTAETPAQPVAALPERTRVLTLAECIVIGRENQPTLAAHRASLAAAEVSKRSIDQSRVPRCLVPDLPARRLQAGEGVTLATAALDAAEIDMVHGVTRTYFLVLYARAQRAVLADLIDSLKGDLEAAEEVVKSGRTKRVTKRDLRKINAYIRQAVIRRLEAERGTTQALAALREAMGVAPDCCVEPADTELPTPDVELCREQVLAAALALRPELRGAASAVTIGHLEVEAQAALHRPLARTVALLADIHSEAPHAIGTPEYRPSVVGYEMPPKLSGSRRTRTERARDFTARAEAVANKTRGLVALDAENAFARWLSARQLLPEASATVKDTVAVVEEIRRVLRTLEAADADKLLADELLAAQARIKYNEERFEYAAGLANLERVTAGGLQLGRLIGQ